MKRSRSAVRDRFAAEAEETRDAIARWQGEGRDVFVYFDNDQKAAAPADARRLIALLDRSA